MTDHNNCLHFVDNCARLDPNRMSSLYDSLFFVMDRDSQIRCFTLGNIFFVLTQTIQFDQKIFKQ